MLPHTGHVKRLLLAIPQEILKFVSLNTSELLLESYQQSRIGDQFTIHQVDFADVNPVGTECEDNIL